MKQIMKVVVLLLWLVQSLLGSLLLVAAGE